MFNKLTIPMKIIVSSLVSVVLIVILLGISSYATIMISKSAEEMDKRATDSYVLNSKRANIIELSLFGHIVLGRKNIKADDKIMSEYERIKQISSQIEMDLTNIADVDDEVKWSKEVGSLIHSTIELIGKEIIPNVGTNKLKNKDWDTIETNLTNLTSKTMSIVELYSNNLFEEKNSAVINVHKKSNLTYVVLAIGLLSLFLGIFLSVRTVISIKKSLNNVISTLSESSTQIISASVEVATESENVSQATNEQASSIQQTTASLEEITGMVNNNLENSKKTAELASESTKIVQGTSASMTALELAMKEILKSNEKIEQLVKIIDNIGEKTEVMNEIVFQTKLLSFNASVEAERAGEHGRGFAVVAQEVGNLAQMSGKASQEIAQIVKDSIKQAESVVIENRKKVEEGNKHVDHVSKELVQISSKALQSESATKQILDASKEQSMGIKQINSAMNQLDKAIQENASTAVRTSNSAQELSAQAAILSATVESIQGLLVSQKARTPNYEAERRVDVTKTPPSSSSAILTTVEDTNKKDSEWEKL